jgi:hypothetical protein
MIDFNYNCSIKEASTHSPIEVIYGYKPSTPVDRLLPLIGATANALDRLTLIADIRDIVNLLVKLSKERIVAISTRTAHISQTGSLFIFRLKVYTSVHKNANNLETKK